jgi:hypothetical protein
MFGISLAAFYLAVLTEPPSSEVLRIVIGPAYYFRVLTGSVLYWLLPGIVDLFWLKELALLAVYFAPLLVIDAVAVRFNRRWHLPGQAVLTLH